MNIIKATINEITELQQISTTTFKETFGADNTKEDMEVYFQNNMSIEVFKKELLSESEDYYLLIDDNKVIGYIKMFIRSNKCKLVRIYVLNEYQGNGYGQKLLDYAMMKAKETKATHLELGVWEHNTKAIKFYQKNKFTIVDNIQFVLGADIQNDYVMQLKIGE